MENQDFKDRSLEAFCTELSSGAAVPGGGGASALCGALAVSLGNMVGNLTVGKKKYAAVEEEMLSLNARAGELRQEFLALIQADADGFAPLAAVYKMPSGSAEEKAEKNRRLQTELVNACAVPERIMECCGETLSLIESYEKDGSVMALSDAAAAALLCRAALAAASLNIRINAKSLDDREKARELTDRADRAVADGEEKADALYRDALSRLR